MTDRAAATASSVSSPRPAALPASMRTPSHARARDFTAVRANPASACATMPMATGLTPYSTPAICGSAPHVTYIHANVAAMRAAGTMKHRPATTRPGQPPRA